MDLKEIKARLKKYTSGKTYLNKYSFVVLIFAVWLCLFDKYDFSTQLELTQNVNKLEAQKKDYEVKLQEALVEQKTLNENVEKYGREKYLFHKDNEEIILIK